MTKEEAKALVIKDILPMSERDLNQHLIDLSDARKTIDRVKGFSIDELTAKQIQTVILLNAKASDKLSRIAIYIATGSFIISCASLYFSAN